MIRCIIFTSHKIIQNHLEFGDYFFLVFTSFFELALRARKVEVVYSHTTLNVPDLVRKVEVFNILTTM